MSKKILGFVLILCLKASASESKKVEFAGLRLAMTLDEAALVLCEKGFLDISRTRVCGEKRGRTLCTKPEMDLSNPDYWMTGCYNTLSKDSIAFFVPHFYKDKLARLKIIFKKPKAKEAMPGVLGKFGLPAGQSDDLSGFMDNDVAKTLCKLGSECHVAQWYDPKAEYDIELLFTGETVKSGEAVTLVLTDIGLMSERDNRPKKAPTPGKPPDKDRKKNEAAAKSLGF